MTAARFALEEQARNRFALALLLIFVPIWDLAIGAMIVSEPVAFRLQSGGAFLQVDGHDLTILTAGFNGITLIVAFMIFATTRRNTSFDRRLVLSGLPQSVAIVAKVIAVVAVSILVALYASLVLLLFWPSAIFGPVWLAYFLDAFIYGALGLLIGVFVTSELPGFFLIIMISLLDTFFQAPVENPLANDPFLSYFPTYGPMQIAVNGGFQGVVPLDEVLLSLAWVAGFGVIGLAIFWFRTRAWNGSRNRRGSTPKVEKG